MTTLRQAAEQALDALEMYQSKSSVQAFDDAVKALRAALAEPEQEPDYWQEEARRYAQNADFWREKYKTDRELMQQALEALNRSDYLGWQFNIPVMTALREALAEQPAQRKPLTDEEIDVLVMDSDGLPKSHLEFARAIEAKLKEKNA